MSDLIQYITGGSTEFTPAVLVGLIVFLCIFDGLCGLVGAIIKGVKR